MNKHIKKYYELFEKAITSKLSPETFHVRLIEITSSMEMEAMTVPDRVALSTYALKLLSKGQRMYLAKVLIEEQIVKQRQLLTHWSMITAQSSMIDTGYIAQHLVSLQTQIAGQGMRGKGDDLCDSSEVKSANFLDSLDKKGETRPRWNFTANTMEIMERFLNYKAIYLLSIDYNVSHNYRIRIWKVNIHEHTILRTRYIEWMDKLGYPKFADTTGKPSVNFQLFPPNSGTEENYARHGTGRVNGFSKLHIPLEDTPGSELIFKAEVIDGQVEILVF
ncbi:MAG: MamI family restriction endonuclease [Lachnospiraceae bacterium]|nr:MamI family restriction endonuclease [Lachnospiraceae bacterium]